MKTFYTVVTCKLNNISKITSSEFPSEYSNLLKILGNRFSLRKKVIAVWPYHLLSFAFEQLLWQTKQESCTVAGYNLYSTFLIKLRRCRYLIFWNTESLPMNQRMILILGNIIHHRNILPEQGGCRMLKIFSLLSHIKPYDFWIVLYFTEAY